MLYRLQEQYSSAILSVIHTVTGELRLLEEEEKANILVQQRVVIWFCH
jgi:hypothetical protein